MAKVVESIASLREYLRDERSKSLSIGFVPTMGWFHDGHLSLMRMAREECDVVVVSIFVNPIQFGPQEDLDEYPRDLERDRRLAEDASVDYIFSPDVSEIYGEGFTTYVEVEGELTDRLCGAARPGHFKGVTTVCAKLFNIVKPDYAYFGQKDFQQALIVKQMVEDLNMPLEIVICPIVRESDGLAMSSRNAYLKPEERKAAVVLKKVLDEAKQMIEYGETDTNTLKKRIKKMVARQPLADLEYVSVCDRINLKDTEKIDKDIVIAIAVQIGKARLIDNIIVRKSGKTVA